MHSADERVGRDEQRQHYPKQSFTTVADTPENLRLKQQSELQSQSPSSVVLWYPGLILSLPPTSFPQPVVE
ncbi:hypothetical protein MG293_011401, partial [Ovis ammon polii]